MKGKKKRRSNSNDCKGGSLPPRLNRKRAARRVAGRWANQRAISSRTRHGQRKQPRQQCLQHLNNDRIPPKDQYVQARRARITWIDPRVIVLSYVVI